MSSLRSIGDDGVGCCSQSTVYLVKSLLVRVGVVDVGTIYTSALVETDDDIDTRRASNCHTQSRSTVFVET